MIRVNVKTGGITKVAKFNFPHQKVRSLNWWGSGITKDARMERARIAKQEREDMKWEFIEKMQKGSVPPSPYHIKLIRKYPTNPDNPLYKPQKIYDDDNMIGGCKHIRDGIAKGLGYKSDSHPDLQWEYEQVKTKDKQELTVIIKTWEE